MNRVNRGRRTDLDVHKDLTKAKRAAPERESDGTAEPGRRACGGTVVVLSPFRDRELLIVREVVLGTVDLAQ